MIYRKVFTVFLLFVFFAPLAAAATPEELEAEIREQSRRLEELNKEIRTTENTLQQVRGEKQNLEREVKTLDVSIRDLETKIKADDTATVKLTAEIGILEYTMAEIETSIGSKRQGIARLVRDLQKEDDDNIFLILFGNQSLAESLEEAQSMSQVRSQLTRDIEALTNLAAERVTKLETTASKKREAELRKANAEDRKLIVEDRKQEKRVILEETKSQEAIYQERVKALKAEQDKLSDEIDRIEQGLRKAFARALLPLGRSGVLAWPVAEYVVTQKFGVRSWLYRGRGHNGLDLGIPVGTPIFAAADGTVMAADNNDKSAWRKYQYGKYVLVRHENGLATLYAHLSRQTVGAGAAVKRGDLVGYSGNTGYSTGPHLHLGLYWASSIEMKKRNPPPPAPPAPPARGPPPLPHSQISRTWSAIY